MRRLGRWLLRGVTAVSLILCIATAALWVRSYSAADRLEWRSQTSWRVVWIAEGSLEISLFRGYCSGYPPDFYGLKYDRNSATPPCNGAILFSALNTDPGDTETDWEWRGFSWCERRETTGDEFDIGVAPFWSLLLVTAVLPAGWMIVWSWSRLRRRGKKRAGLCPSCGYDLRATPERCPECGSVPAKG